MPESVQLVTLSTPKRGIYWLKIAINAIIVFLILGIANAMPLLWRSGHVAPWVEGVFCLLLAPILAFIVVGYIAEDTEFLWWVVVILSVLNLYGLSHGPGSVLGKIVSWALSFGLVSLEMLAGKAIASLIPRRKKA